MNINKIDSNTNFNGYLLVSGHTISSWGDTRPEDCVNIPTSQITEISVNKNDSDIIDIKWNIPGLKFGKEQSSYITHTFADINTILNAYNATKDDSLKVDLVG